MPNPYGELFSARGTKAFSGAGLLARLPLPITHMGILTMLSELRGEYALAGAVAGTFTLSMALIAPQTSRLVDRLGQGRVLFPATGISVAALGGLVLCASNDAPVWTLFVLAFFAGFMPSMGAMVRARWTEIYRGTPRLNVAYSLEAVVDELTYIVGPAFAVMLGTSLFPEAGPVVALLLLLVGVLLFVPQKATEPAIRPRPADRGRQHSVLRSPTVLVLALTLLSGGAIVGTVDTMALAFAQSTGQKGSAGIVFTMYAVGSALSGLTFGVRQWKAPLPRMMLVGVGGIALTTVPFLFVNSVAALAATVFFAGVFFAPTTVVMMGIVEKVTPAARLTEGMTWMIAGLNIGIALGAALSGQVVDAYGIGAGFAVALGFGALALLLALGGVRRVTAELRRAEESVVLAGSAVVRQQPAECR
ncbi:MFS transporter [Streptomyces spiroverticillatus]|uniref:MFS transporter n=1 Tax=Streptomyces finlayi TaxID=67296 RepID=A0A919CC71_9ACTN|nr:MFS transporter [Streptomyces finlayi]GHA23669.1 MFS transporter [Streptomyces spiroverticillatus]GHD04882.1 MFS transporter [Streptomyces finlayi]